MGRCWYLQSHNCLSDTLTHERAGWEIGDKIDQATDPDIDIATITGPDVRSEGQRHLPVLLVCLQGNVITISNTGCT